jgi:hypothetical protein
MSLRTGFQSTIIKLTIPAAASGVAYSNGGLAIGSLKAGRYLCVLNYGLDPVNAGANITGATAVCTAFNLVGQPTAIALIQQQVVAANAADINCRHSSSSVVDLTADASVYISIFATTSAGNYIGSVAVQDTYANSISFIRLQ